MSGSRITRPKSPAATTTAGSTSQAAITTRLNRAPAGRGERYTTRHASAGRGQGSGVSSAATEYPSQERAKETEAEIEQRLVAQEEGLGTGYVEELGNRA